MADMLVKLFKLNCFDIELERKLQEEGIYIKKALAPNRTRVMEFAKIYGGQGWADEVASAFSNSPVTCYIATKDNKVIGFACYEATAKAFFGPTAVDENYRRKGIGKALLLRSLFSLKELGYGYAFIGAPAEKAIKFYQEATGGVIIEDELPSVYTQMIEYENK